MSSVESRHQACDACKTRKVKCSGGDVCLQCKKLDLRCEYSPRMDKSRRRIRRGTVIAQYRKDGPVSPPMTAPIVTPQAELNVISKEFSDKQFFLGLVGDYMQNIYPMFPVVDEHELRQCIDRISTSHMDASFVHAMAAVTIGHTGAGTRNSQEKKEFVSKLMESSIDLRGAYRPNSLVTIQAIMISVMLSSSLVGSHDVDIAWLYLREAITLATIMRVSEPDAQLNLPLEERARRQRLHWMLFIHERFMAIHCYRPVLLSPLDRMPEKDPQVPDRIHNGYIQLIKLFSLVDSNFINAYLGDRSKPLNEKWVHQKQQEIKKLSGGFEDLTEMQQVDLIISQQWLRMLVWQMSMSHYLLESQNITEDCMSLLFPVEIAKRIRTLMANCSPRSIEVHGAAIVEKLYELAICIADVVALVPTADPLDRGQADDFMWISQFLLKQPSISREQKEKLESKLRNVRVVTVVEGGLSWSPPAIMAAQDDPWLSLSKSVSSDTMRSSSMDPFSFLPMMPNLGKISEISQDILNGLDVSDYSRPFEVMEEAELV